MTSTTPMTRLTLALAALLVTAAAAGAAPSPKGSWRILQNIGSGECIGTRIQNAVGYSVVGGSFATQQQAEAAIRTIPRCYPYLRMIGKDPFGMYRD